MSCSTQPTSVYTPGSVWIDSSGTSSDPLWSKASARATSCGLDDVIRSLEVTSNGRRRAYSVKGCAQECNIVLFNVFRRRHALYIWEIGICTQTGKCRSDGQVLHDVESGSQRCLVNMTGVRIHTSNGGEDNLTTACRTSECKSSDKAPKRHAEAREHGCAIGEGCKIGGSHWLWTTKARQR